MGGVRQREKLKAVYFALRRRDQLGEIAHDSMLKALEDGQGMKFSERGARFYRSERERLARARAELGKQVAKISLSPIEAIEAFPFLDVLLDSAFEEALTHPVYARVIVTLRRGLEDPDPDLQFMCRVLLERIGKKSTEPPMLDQVLQSANSTRRYAGTLSQLLQRYEWLRGRFWQIRRESGYEGKGDNHKRLPENDLLPVPRIGRDSFGAGL